MRRAFIGCLFSLICFVSLPALAGTLYDDYEGRPVQLQVENEFRVDWYRDFQASSDFLPEDFVRIENELTFNLSWSVFRFGGDVMVRGTPDKLYLKYREPIGQDENGETLFETVSVEQSHQDTQVYAEKLYFVYDKRPLRADVGDYYLVLGRGLALAMRKEPGGEVDNTLRGLKLEVSVQDTTMIFFTGLSNTLQIDPVNQAYQEDPLDLISGFRIQQRFADMVTVGVHGVDARFAPLIPDRQKRHVAEIDTGVWGGNLEVTNIADMLTLYTEAAFLHRSARKLDDDLMAHHSVYDTGWGVYAGMDFNLEGFSALLEYKDYNDFVFRRGKEPIQPYMREISPTLQQQHQALQSALAGARYPAPTALNLSDTAPSMLRFNSDTLYSQAPNLEHPEAEIHDEDYTARGARLRLGYYIVDIDGEPYLNGYYSRNRSMGTASTSLGGFGATNEHNGGEKIRGMEIWHVYGGWRQLIGNVEGHVEAGFRNEYDLDQNTGFRQTLHAELGVKAPVAAHHLVEGDLKFKRKDEQLIKRLETRTGVNLGYTWTGYFSVALLYTYYMEDLANDQGSDSFDHYLAGELRSRFAEWIELAVFGGQVAPGYLCTGGQCRQVPEFKGVQGKVTLRW